MNELNFTLFQNSLPPCNTDAEEAILGGILLDHNSMERLGKTALQPESFYLSAHQRIYQVCLNLHKQGKPTDLMTVADWLYSHKQLDAVGGQLKLASLVDRTVSAVNIDRYADIVVEKAVRRQLISLGNQIVSSSYDSANDAPDIIKNFQEAVEALKNAADPTSKSIKKYRSLIKKIGDIEMSDLDPGARRFELLGLSKEFGLPIRELEDIYFKSLIDKENEPLQSLEELFTKYSNTERKWLMQGLLPQGITALLHAKGGVGKTLLAYYLAYCLLSGKNLDQFTATKSKRKGWILQTDESPEDMVQRLRDISFTEDMELKVKTRWTFDHIPTLRKEIERDRPDFIIIDSVTSCSKNSIVSENDVVYARPVLLLNEIAAEFGCTILLIHHSSHKGNARGTTALHNAVGLVMRLETDPQSHDPMERLLTFQKARSRSTAKYRLRMDWETNAWTVLQQEGEDPDNPTATTKQSIVDYLERHRGVAFERLELYSVIGSTIDNVRRCAAQLAADGIILKRGTARRGDPSKYFLPAMDGSPVTECKVSEQLINGQKRCPETMPRNYPSPSNGSGVSDQLIIENSHFAVVEEPQNLKKCDQLIRNSPNPDISRKVSDHVSDHHSIVTDSSHQKTDIDDQKQAVELEIGRKCEIKSDLPSMESFNNRQRVIDLVGAGVCRIKFDDGGYQYVPHQYLFPLVGQDKEESAVIQSLIFSDKISTKSGKRSGYVSKVRGYKSNIKKYEITWHDTDETITYSIEEIQIAGFRKI